MSIMLSLLEEVPNFKAEADAAFPSPLLPKLFHILPHGYHTWAN